MGSFQSRIACLQAGIGTVGYLPVDRDVTGSSMRLRVGMLVTRSPLVAMAITAEQWRPA